MELNATGEGSGQVTGSSTLRNELSEVKRKAIEDSKRSEGDRCHIRDLSSSTACDVTHHIRIMPGIFTKTHHDMTHDMACVVLRENLIAYYFFPGKSTF